MYGLRTSLVLATLLLVGCGDDSGPGSDVSDVHDTSGADADADADADAGADADADAAEGSCAVVLACMQACGADEACIGVCRAAICTAGSGALNAVLSCVGSSCSSVCAHPTDPGCQDCVNSSCATQLAECAASTGC